MLPPGTKNQLFCTKCCHLIFIFAIHVKVINKLMCRERLSVLLLEKLVGKESYNSQQNQLGQNTFSPLSIF